MEIHTTRLDLNKSVHYSKGNDNNVETNSSTYQFDIEEAESERATLTLSSNALSMLDFDKTQSDKTYEQKKVEYEVAKRNYQEKVNDLPADYRKMKVIKDRIDAEIKNLKAEISKIKQSITLNEEEKKQSIRVLEEQIADKSLVALEVRKEFTEKLKEQERSKQISPENATVMLKTFNSSPPEEPINNV